MPHSLPRRDGCRGLRRVARTGFTLIELIMVVAIVGVMMAIVVPRFRITPETELQLAAMQLAQDIDLARTRALSTRSLVRVAFVSGARTYTGFLDNDGNSAIGETQAERDALRGFATRTLPTRINYGRGSRGAVPDNPGGGDITFANAHLEFDSRGIAAPFGAGGVIYLAQVNSPAAGTAVAVSPAGSVRIWTWRNGGWE